MNGEFMKTEKNENRFYVYVHRLKATGDVFYIGSGTGFRFSTKSNRSKKWHSVTENGYVAEKICENLTLSEAREMEGLLISMFHEDTLVNFHKPVVVTHLDDAILSDFSYSADSPSGLIWNVSQNRGRHRHDVGDVAGYMETRNGQPHRWRVKPTGGSALAVHRIVWALHYPLDKEKLVDHIDGNPFNNKLENLREVTHLGNARNMKKSSANKSGVTGVYYKVNKSGDTYWVATWRDSQGKSKTKNYMVGCYGYDEAFALACAYRKKIIEELNSQEFSYTNRS